MRERGFSSSSKKNPSAPRKGCYQVIETSAIWFLYNHARVFYAASDWNGISRVTTIELSTQSASTRGDQAWNAH